MQPHTPHMFAPCYSCLSCAPLQQPLSPSMPSTPFPAFQGARTLRDRWRRTHPDKPRRGLGGCRCGAVVLVRAVTSGGCCLAASARMGLPDSLPRPARDRECSGNSFCCADKDMVSGEHACPCDRCGYSHWPTLLWHQQRLHVVYMPTPLSTLLVLSHVPSHKKRTSAPNPGLSS